MSQRAFFQNWEISKIWSGAHSTYPIPQVDKKEKKDFSSIYKNPFPYDEDKLLNIFLSIIMMTAY